MWRLFNVEYVTKYMFPRRPGCAGPIWLKKKSNPVIFRKISVIFRTNPFILRTNPGIFRTNAVPFWTTWDNIFD